MDKFVKFVKRNKKVIVVAAITQGAFTLLVVLVVGGFVYANRAELFDYFARHYIADSEGKRIEQNRYGRAVFSEEATIVDVVTKANPAVVSIVVTKDVPIIERYFENLDPFGGFFNDPFWGFDFQVPRIRERGTERREVGGGSGFFVSKDGLIITNRHVVADTEAEYTVFTNDGDMYNARVLARDPVLDVAVLKIEAFNTPYLEFGNSDEIRIGQTVIAIGNALGEFRNSVSVGVVSGLSRSVIAGDNFGRLELLEEVIQTDAAINPGNSGGPLLNSSGRVIGVNVVVARGAENIGFALPSNLVESVVRSVVEHGEIVRPYLGVRYVQVTPVLKERHGLPVDYGVLVVSGGSPEHPAVVRNSPANKAGIKENDIILELDGVRIDEKRSLGFLIRQRSIGDTIVLKVLRNGEEKIISAILERAPEN
jgi:serine protease Do